MMSWFQSAQLWQGLLTAVIGVTALLIHRQQAVTNRRQYRLALFERRMRIFDSAMRLIAVILRDANVEQRRVFQFLQETREVELLFGSDIKAYLDQLYHQALELHVRDLGASRGNQEDINKRTELINWFHGQNGVATKNFLKYIDFREP